MTNDERDPALPAGTRPLRRSRFDVVVIGGGLAGLATAIHTARSGLSVCCVEPSGWRGPTVGESLEFSAPGLLEEIGFSSSDLLRSGVAYPKEAVRIVGPDDDFSVWPPAFYRRWPIRCSRSTVHVDRRRLDPQLADLARAAEVTILEDRVARVDVDRDGDRDGDAVTGISTANGARLHARWYVDATGGSVRLLGRALAVPRTAVGPSRVAYWTIVETSPSDHATTLHFDDDEQLGWAWEIPLAPDQVSVGLCLPAAAAVNARRAGARSQLEIFAWEARRFPQLHLPSQRGLGPVHATSYQTYRHTRTCGRNWVLVGEAAAVVDPLTSNGVASALRFGAQASSLIVGDLTAQPAGALDRWRYERQAPAMVALLNTSIERMIYRPTVRRRFGLRAGIIAYAAASVANNGVYADRSPMSTRSVLGWWLSSGWWRSAFVTVERIIGLRAGERGVPSQSTQRPVERSNNRQVETTRR